MDKEWHEVFKMDLFKLEYSHSLPPERVLVEVVIGDGEDETKGMFVGTDIDGYEWRLEDGSITTRVTHWRYL